MGGLKLDAANWIGIGSAVIAIAALVNAVMARRIANRGYLLAVEARDATRPSLDLYIDQGYIRYIAGRKMFIFRLVVTNRSDSPNALKTIRLLIEHQRADGPASHLEVLPDNSYAAVLGFASADLLTIPSAIAQRAVVAGTVLFPVTKELLADTRIEAYAVSLKDTFDLDSQREVLLLTERPVE